MSLGTQASLPVSATPLVGREGDLDQLCAALAGPGVRLVTLTDNGGLGKTRLALAAAAALRQGFPHCRPRSPPNSAPAPGGPPDRRRGRQPAAGRPAENRPRGRHDGAVPGSSARRRHRPGLGRRTGRRPDADLGRSRHAPASPGPAHDMVRSRADRLGVACPAVPGSGARLTLGRAGCPAPPSGMGSNGLLCCSAGCRSGSYRAGPSCWPAISVNAVRASVSE